MESVPERFGRMNAEMLLPMWPHEYRILNTWQEMQTAAYGNETGVIRSAQKKERAGRGMNLHERCSTMRHTNVMRAQ